MVPAQKDLERAKIIFRDIRYIVREKIDPADLAWLEGRYIALEVITGPQAKA